MKTRRPEEFTWNLVPRPKPLSQWLLAPQIAPLAQPHPNDFAFQHSDKHGGLDPKPESPSPDLEPRRQSMLDLAVDLDENLAGGIHRAGFDDAHPSVLDPREAEMRAEVEKRALANELREGKLPHHHQIEESVGQPSLGCHLHSSPEEPAVVKGDGGDAKAAARPGIHGELDLRMAVLGSGLHRLREVAAPLPPAHAARDLGRESERSGVDEALLPAIREERAADVDDHGPSAAKSVGGVREPCGKGEGAHEIPAGSVGQDSQLDRLSRVQDSAGAFLDRPVTPEGDQKIASALRFLAGDARGVSRARGETALEGAEM